LIDIKIGLVTGATSFFVLRSSSLAEYSLRKSDCSVLISKFRHTSGIVLTEEDVALLRSSNDRVLLIKCSQKKLSNRVKTYLDTFPVEIRNKIATFEKREPWYKLDDKQIPDGFLPCLVRGAPRLVLNYAGLNCTNNVLRIWFKREKGQFLPEILAIALTSTVGQVAVETFGRACGSGGLKIEPGDWQRVRLLVPANASQGEIGRAFLDVNELLRNGRHDAARHAADAFLLRTIPIYPVILI